jgi:hypothetical protein
MIAAFESAARLTSDPVVRDLWLCLCLLVMVGPLGWLALWCNKRVTQPERPRARCDGVGASRLSAANDDGYARDMAAIRWRVRCFIALWLPANIVMFGLLILATWRT